MTDLMYTGDRILSPFLINETFESGMNILHVVDHPYAIFPDSFLFLTRKYLAVTSSVRLQTNFWNELHEVPPPPLFFFFNSARNC